MGSHRLLFIDIETTGHDPVRLENGVLVSWHEIIDLAALLVYPEERMILKSFEVKIKPDHPKRCMVNPQLINRYLERAADGEWRNAVTLEHAIDKLVNFIEWKPVVLCGQNFFFDWSFLSVAFAICGYRESKLNKILHYSKIDTRSMAIQELREPGTQFDPNDWSIRNEQLLKKLGLEPEPEVHTAMNGAWKSFEVFCRLEELKTTRL